MPIERRRGQALIELALGLFVIVILVSALFYFARFMLKSLAIQNQLRSSSPVFAATVEPEKTDETIFRKIFGMKTLHIKEPHGSTDRTIPNTGGLNP